MSTTRRNPVRATRRPNRRIGSSWPSSPSSTTASATCARPRRRSSGSAPTPGSPPTRRSSATRPASCCPASATSAGAWRRSSDSGLDELAIECAGVGPAVPRCVRRACRCSTRGPRRARPCPGSGVLPGMVRRLPDDVKRPQMQWNVLVRRGPTRPARRAARPDVGLLRALVRRRRATSTPSPCATTAAPWWPPSSTRRLWATQFHPEKSGANGLRILANFVARAAAAAEAA